MCTHIYGLWVLVLSYVLSKENSEEKLEIFNFYTIDSRDGSRVYPQPSFTGTLACTHNLCFQ